MIKYINMKTINTAFKALSKESMSLIKGGTEIPTCNTPSSSGSAPIPFPGASSSTSMISGGPGSAGGGSSIATSNGDEAGVVSGTIGFNTNPTKYLIACQNIEVVSLK